jgi:hypothetical protein
MIREYLNKIVLQLYLRDLNKKLDTSKTNIEINGRLQKTNKGIKYVTKINAKGNPELVYKILTIKGFGRSKPIIDPSYLSNFQMYGMYKDISVHFIADQLLNAQVKNDGQTIELEGKNRDSSDRFIQGFTHVDYFLNKIVTVDFSE